MCIVFVLLYLKMQSLEVAIQNESCKKDQKFSVLNGRIEVEIGFMLKRITQENHGTRVYFSLAQGNCKHHLDHYENV